MALGDLIARLSDEDVAEETLLNVTNLVLLAEFRARAEAEGLDLGTYTAAVVNRYASEAPDEEWVSLIGAMGRAHDPAATYLERALAYDVRRSAGTLRANPVPVG